MKRLLDYIGRMADGVDDTVERAMEEGRRYAEAHAKPPTPIPATKQLRTNLGRVTLAYNDRERVLVKEIADREAELADVRRARDATTAALIELDVDAERVEEEINGGAGYAEVDRLPIDDIDALQVEALAS